MVENPGKVIEFENLFPTPGNVWKMHICKGILMYKPLDKTVLKNVIKEKKDNINQTEVDLNLQNKTKEIINFE